MKISQTRRVSKEAMSDSQRLMVYLAIMSDKRPTLTIGSRGAKDRPSQKRSTAIKFVETLDLGCRVIRIAGVEQLRTLCKVSSDAIWPIDRPGCKRDAKPSVRVKNARPGALAKPFGNLGNLLTGNWLPESRVQTVFLAKWRESAACRQNSV